MAAAGRAPPRRGERVGTGSRRARRPQDSSTDGLADGSLVVGLGQAGCSCQETVGRVTERQRGEGDDPARAGVETGEPVADRTVRETGVALVGGETAADQLLDEVRDAVTASGQCRHLVRGPVVGAEGAGHRLHVLRASRSSRTTVQWSMRSSSPSSGRTVA